MKFWIGLLAICAIILYLYYPIINKERQCYQTVDLLTDQLATNVLNNRVASGDQCTQSTQILFDLENCIQEATSSSTLATYTNGTIQTVVDLSRPYSENLWRLKVDHNAACTSEPDQLP